MNFDQKVKPAPKQPPAKADLWVQEKLKKQIESLRLSNEEEVSQLKIQVRNQTKREMRDYIKQIEHDFTLYRLKLDEEFNDIRDAVSKKDRYIEFLLHYIFEQEMIMTEFRLIGSPSIEAKEADLSYTEFSELRNQLKTTKIQLEALKDVCAEYKACLLYTSDAADE